MEKIMKCLILAAGYATRLYPLTENFPKPLLPVCGRSILDILIDDVESSGVVDEYIVISNHKFYTHFEEWAKSRPERVTVIDDGTSTNETRLGAVRDVQFAIDKLSLDDELLVLAGDNLLDFSLTRFISFAKNKGTSCVMRYTEPDPKRLTKSGVLLIGDDDLVLEMWEKPADPKSDQCCPPFYFFTREDARLVGEALSAGCSADAPGGFIEWLAFRSRIHAMPMPGRRYDIGNLESYERVQAEYKPLS
jgi:glucose-1-phosphate thymidylyltransferase